MPDRNAKVRRRIAAGKFRLRIRDLRNLGPRAEQLLAGVGILSTESLRRRGALAAYLAVSRAAEGGVVEPALGPRGGAGAVAGGSRLAGGGRQQGTAAVALGARGGRRGRCGG